jgi:ABC-type nitrate/sulfonate/bicarbonate transport system permease component
VTTNSKTASARFWGVHAKPSKWLRFFLGTIPFLIIIVGYQIASDFRHQENPNDKLLPGFGQMWDSMKPMVVEPDKRTGDYRLYEDTKASLKRLVIGVGIAFFLALWLGLNSGFFGGMSALSMPMVTFISMIPPMALLPILFISLGINELGKITLIFIGTFPIMARDIYLATRSLPGEQISACLSYCLASNHAACVRYFTFKFGCCLVICYCFRSHCGNRGFGVQNIFGKALYVDGYYYSVCGMDYAAWVND